MSHLIIKHGRHETIICRQTGATRMLVDGRGLLDSYSPEELIAMSRAYWNAAPIEARRAATVKQGVVHESGKSRPE